MVVLGLRDRAGLEALVAAQQDPHTVRFRRWAEVEELADRFGPPRSEYARVREWLTGHGLTVVRDSPLRAVIVVTGSAAAAESAFGTQLAFFRYRNRTVHAPRTEPVLPADVAPLVRGILGLDDLPHFHPLVSVDSTACGGRVPCTALAPADFAAVYGVTPLLAAGLTGTGEAIAVVARSNFRDSDLSLFASRYRVGASANLPRRRYTGADPGVLTAEGEETEALLDAEWAGALAPGAQVNVVIGSPAGDIDEALITAVQDHVGDIISISFGLCEPASSALRTELFDAFYTIANAQGQTVLVAAGDGGAADCDSDDGNALAVNLLASSPHAVAVGGTELDPGFDPAGNATGLLHERVWNDDYGAGGGGESAVFARPPFQLGPGLPASLRGRALPDLALAASPLSPGYVIVQAARADITGGTSASAPALASAVALINQRLGSVGLGQLLPALYRAAGKQVLGLSAPVFHDVVEGDNRTANAGYRADVAFDLASGWGSPDIAQLADALAAPERCEPALACMVPGSTSARRSCRGEWLIDRTGHTLDGRGLPARRQVCRDGDPGCDLDGTIDGRCTLAVSLCLNVFDFRTLNSRGLPACSLRPVHRVHFDATGATRPDRSIGRGNHEAVQAAVRGLPPLPSDLATNCTATAPVVVPLTPRGTPGRVRLRAHIDTTTSRLTLVCTP